MSTKYKRVNVLIRPDQQARVVQEGLALSGLVRDLIDDRFSKTVVSLSVSPRTRKMYDLVVSNFGVSDRELERYIVEALDAFLRDKASEIDELREELIEMEQNIKQELVDTRGVRPRSKKGKR